MVDVNVHKVMFNKLVLNKAPKCIKHSLKTISSSKWCQCDAQNDHGGHVHKVCQHFEQRLKWNVAQKQLIMTTTAIRCHATRLMLTSGNGRSTHIIIDVWRQLLLVAAASGDFTTVNNAVSTSMSKQTFTSHSTHKRPLQNLVSRQLTALGIDDKNEVTQQFSAVH